MATELMQEIPIGEQGLYSLRKILIAHDFSESANRALTDAMALASRFHAEIVIAHVEPFDFGSNPLHKHVCSDLENLRQHLTSAGHQCKNVLRSGHVAKTLTEVLDEEHPDLLLLGAYGHGSQVRETLGSTAERLLRSVPCPILTYGPKETKSLAHDGKPMSILVPIELPCSEGYLGFAVSVAKLFNAKLEILHVVDMGHTISLPHAYQDVQYTCEEIACHLRTGGTQVSGSLLFGKPSDAIISRSQELRSSLILMPLETRRFLSSKVSDNVAAEVIRHAEVPVMTYRLD
jgi:Universal stress protein UspA and related nucleotide-binding proteins